MFFCSDDSNYILFTVIARTRRQNTVYSTYIASRYTDEVYYIVKRVFTEDERKYSTIHTYRKSSNRTPASNRTPL